MRFATLLGLLAAFGLPARGADKAEIGYEAIPAAKQAKPIRGVAFSPDGKWLMSGGEDDIIRTWDISTGLERKQLKGDTAGCLLLPPIGDDIAACQGGDSIRTYRFEENGLFKYIQELRSSGAASVTAVAWSRSGERLFSANSNGAIKEWDVKARKEVKLKGGGLSTYSDITAAPDERAVIASGLDWTFRMVPEGDQLKFRPSRKGSAAVFLDGSFERGYSVLMGNRDGSLEVDTVNPRALPDQGTIKIDQKLSGEHARAVRRIVVSQDGTYFASSASSGEVVLWNRGRQAIGRGKHLYEVRALAFSRDGRFLASGDENGTVRIWQVQPFRLLVSLVSFANGNTLAYDPEGNFAGAAPDQQVGLWRKNGEVAPAPPGRRSALAIFTAAKPTLRTENKKKEEERKAAPPVTVSNAPVPQEIPPTGPRVTPPERKESPPLPDPALVEMRAAATQACKTGELPARFNIPPKWRRDAEFGAVARKCMSQADADLREAQTWIATNNRAGGCRVCVECGKQIPASIPVDLSPRSKQAGDYRAALKAANTRYAVAQFADPEKTRADANSREARFQLGMLELCFLGPLDEAARMFDSIEPPNAESQDRARQAYARLALSRAIKAFDDSKLAEVDKQLSYFRQQRGGIQSAAVLGEEEPDTGQANALATRLRGKRLYQAGVNSVDEGHLEDGQAALSEARKLLGPNDPESANIAKLLDQLEAIQSRTKRIEAALQESEKAWNGGDLETARTKAKEAITLAGPSNPMVSAKAEDLLAAVDQRQRKERLASFIRWGVTGGTGLLILLVGYTIPTGRVAIYSAMGLRRQAAHVDLTSLAAKATNSAALLRLYNLRSLPMVSERLTELFRAYLAQSPNDGKIVFAAGKWALECDDKAQASALLGRALALGINDPELFRALLRLPSAAVEPGADNLRKIAAEQPEHHEAALVLARHNMAEGDIQPDALALYESVLRASPEDDGFRLDTIRAWLRAGSASQAVRHLETLLGRGEAGPAVLDLLVAAARAGEAAEAIRLLALPAVGDIDRLRAGESIAEIDQSCRHQVDLLYGSTPTGSDEVAAKISRAHYLAGTGDVAGAAALAEEARLAGTEQDAEHLAEVARLLRRLVDQEGQDLDSMAPRLALARTETARWNFARAFAELETLRRQARATTEVREEMRRALSRMSLRETTVAFFRQAGWSIDGDGTQTAPPSTADPQVSRRFAKARIHIAETELEVEEILKVRDEMQTGAAFLVAPERPRRGVYALLYATLVDFRDLSLIPLDRATMKTALADATAADVLAQALVLWLGRGDVFDERNPISDGAAFFGRGPLIHQLLNKIVNRQNFGLYGLRKMGKTSLVFQLREGLPANILLLYIDLQGTIRQSCAELCCQIVDELRIQMSAKAPGFSASFAMPSNDGQLLLADALTGMEAALSAALRAMGEGGMDARILLVLDEIERLIPHAGYAGFAGFQEFFRLIRGMYQQRRQVVSAVVGADPTLCRLGKWGGLDNPVFQYYDEIFLAPLDRAECDAMVQGLAAILGVDFETESLRVLYGETAGHPFVTRQLCSRIIQRFQKRPLVITPEMVSAGEAEYLELRSEYLREIFEYYLDKDAQALLEGIADRKTPHLDRAELEGVIAEAVESADAGMRALQELELFHLLVRRNGGFEMPMGILMRYLRSDWKKIEFDKAE